MGRAVYASPMSPPSLLRDIGVAEFDRLHEDAGAWRPVIEAIARRRSDEPVVQMTEGTVLVALLGRTQALKLYPPFLRDHFEFECAALARLGGRLRVPTPVLLQSGEHQGWPWLLMTQLAGEPLTAVWPGLSEAQKCALLSDLGVLAAEVHALPVGGLARHAPPWGEFLAGQRARCAGRQQRTGLPPHLLDQLDTFLQGDVPQGPDVILTGEYTPMNLLAQKGCLAGMFDFGDGLIGPHQYDWLGPMCFLAAGSAQRCRAFLGGYGAEIDAPARLALLRLMLLHRYSNLQAQIAVPDWQRSESFEELAAMVWPECGIDTCAGPATWSPISSSCGE